MNDYNFPKDLYIRLEEVKGQGLKAEIYRRVETDEKELLHMKRAGLIWLKPKDINELEKRLKDESSWNAKG